MWLKKHFGGRKNCISWFMIAIFFLALWYFYPAIRCRIRWRDSSSGEPWQYMNQFESILQHTTRIVVRDDGFNCCKVFSQPPILF